MSLLLYFLREIILHERKIFKCKLFNFTNSVVDVLVECFGNFEILKM